ncbi:MAG: 30S ribosomal protein S8 [Thermodesulfobacteriota bacterium]
MTMTDPISDMLTRIRNAAQAKHKTVNVPASKLKKEVARILKEEGYIEDYSMKKEGRWPVIRIALKYAPSQKNVITKIERVSKPGLRRYVDKKDVPRVLGGLGIAIISTSKGLLTDKKARELGVGGEVLCNIY